MYLIVPSRPTTCRSSWSAKINAIPAKKHENASEILNYRLRNTRPKFVKRNTWPTKLKEVKQARINARIPYDVNDVFNFYSVIYEKYKLKSKTVELSTHSPS